MEAGVQEVPGACSGPSVLHSLEAECSPRVSQGTKGREKNKTTTKHDVGPLRQKQGQGSWERRLWTRGAGRGGSRAPDWWGVILALPQLHRAGLLPLFVLRKLSQEGRGGGRRAEKRGLDMVRGGRSGTRLPEFKSQLCHSSAMCPLQVTYPLCLSFLICKLGVVSISWIGLLWWLNKFMSIRHSEQY